MHHQNPRQNQGYHEGFIDFFRAPWSPITAQCRGLNIGFWGPSTSSLIFIRNHHRNSIGPYLGPYIKRSKSIRAVSLSGSYIRVSGSGLGSALTFRWFQLGVAREDVGFRDSGIRSSGFRVSKVASPKVCRGFNSSLSRVAPSRVVAVSTECLRMWTSLGSGRGQGGWNSLGLEFFLFSFVFGNS